MSWKFRLAVVTSIYLLPTPNRSLFIGGNTYIYRGRFEVPLAAAISHAVRSDHFLRAKNVDDGVREGREAVRLGSGDPRTHLALALALARSGQNEEAIREFETAFLQAKADPRFRNAEVKAQQELSRLKLRR